MQLCQTVGVATSVGQCANPSQCEAAWRLNSIRMPRLRPTACSSLRGSAMNRTEWRPHGHRDSKRLAVSRGAALSVVAPRDWLGDEPSRISTSSSRHCRWHSFQWATPWTHSSHRSRRHYEVFDNRQQVTPNAQLCQSEQFEPKTLIPFGGVYKSGGSLICTTIVVAIRAHP
jgi:hypothetical protein